MYFSMVLYDRKTQNARKKCVVLIFARVCPPGASGFSITHFRGIVYIYFLSKKTAEEMQKQVAPCA